jgi:hypothetical protein
MPVTRFVYPFEDSSMVKFARLAGAFVAASIVFHLATIAPAFSWFDKGHRVVGLIAEANLSAAARSEVKKILDGMTLADAAIWPDHEGRSIRDFDPLHYVTIPENAAGYDQARDCPERNCMVEALRWFLTAVADRSSPIMARRLALHYVAHLVGDMHQPLHAGRAKDSGGTGIRVSYRGAETNLHFFWDTNLVEMESGTAEEVARRLAASITNEEKSAWQSGNSKEWTEESLALVRSYAYKTGDSGELSAEYVEKARPIVRRRLAQAGVRLAWALNVAFSSAESKSNK